MNDEDDSVYRTFKVNLQCENFDIAYWFKKSVEYTIVFGVTAKLV